MPTHLKLPLALLLSTTVINISNAADPVTTPAQPTIEMLETVPAPQEPVTEPIDPKVDPEPEQPEVLPPLTTQNDILTEDSEHLALAIEYEAYFYKHFDSFRTNTNKFYASSVPSGSNADKHYTYQGIGSGPTGYGGLAGVRMYHLYDEMFALGRMIRLSAMVSPDHTATYIDMATNYIDEYVPKLVSGDGTQYCGKAKNMYYCNASPAQHRFLDATRALAWLGYLMETVLIVEPSYADQYKDYAISLRKTLDRFIFRASMPNIAHMASHPALGAYALGEIGGYLDSYIDDIAAGVNGAVIGNIQKSGWVTSDAGHAEQTINFMHYAYEKQVRGEKANGAKDIATTSMGAMGEKFLDVMKLPIPGALRFEGKILGQYGLLIKYSTGIKKKSGSPESYPVGSPTGSHRVTESLSTVASIAYSYALK